MDRRSFLLISLAATAVFSTKAAAHEGHGISHIKFSVTITKRRGDTLHIALTMFNQGSAPVTLEGLTVDGAEVLKLDRMVVAAGSLSESLLCVRFPGAVPGIFTMMVDFGEDGQGPVTVTV
ncbi:MULTISPECIES: hypothetical protein [unclassified Shimia]|uniref:hypothetical protein n=1 Tax=unclassified Shimia TaxID=2630038 RepID=UPI00310A1811